MGNVFAVFGASGFGREVMPQARSQLLDNGGDIRSLYFIDDGLGGTVQNGHRVLTYQEFLQVPADDRYVSVAIANHAVRQSIVQRLDCDGVKAWSVLASNCLILDDVSLGDGAVICPFVTLTSNIRIGKQFHANIYSYVAHDCVIGDYVTFAPNVMCNGNVVVEDFAYIGTAAVIKQGSAGHPLVIGRGAVVGMGAVVTKSVGPGEVVVGNPARILKRSQS